MARKDKIKFSIITPTYNRSKNGYLQLAIKSIQNQLKGDFEYEHIIVDDGSTDNTKKIVSNFIINDSRLKYHYQENHGAASATARGIKEAAGDYVVFLDDDDEYPKDSLKKRSLFIKNNPKADWFYGKAQKINKFSHKVRTDYQSQYYKDHQYERLLIGNYIHGGTQTVKARIAKEIHWDKRVTYVQDYYMCLELMRPEKEYQVGFLDDVVYFYRWYDSMYTYQTTINNSKYKKDQKMINYVKSTHPEHLVFLANEAKIIQEEVNRINTVLESEKESFNESIFQLKEKVDNYEKSRMIGFSIRFRNVTRRLQKRIKGLLLRCIYLPKRMIIKLFNKYRSLYNKKVGTVTGGNVETMHWPSNKPIISVVTPFYNQGETLPDTVNSVLSQTLQNFEYIIINDGSTCKKSIEVVESIQHPKIKVVNQKNMGKGSPAAARNIGITMARGKYVLCLDSDDWIDPTYLEKTLCVLEAYPDISMVGSDMQTFGAVSRDYSFGKYDAMNMLNKNYISTAAVFLKDAWVDAGGYKEGIGYEDWEFWISLSEKGYWGKNISERLLHYYTAPKSRYIEDKEKHSDNIKKIRELHPKYKSNIRKLKVSRGKKRVSENPFVNLLDGNNYSLIPKNGLKNTLIVIPWMTFGGAETLIYNFAKEIKNDFNISFITGLECSNEWEYKFKEITDRIYHLSKLYDNDNMMHLEFISNYINTRNIDILHVIHNGFMFEMLPEIKRRHPKLKVIVTMFNDRVEYFEKSIEYKKYVDVYSSDNNIVGEHYKKRVNNKVRVVPNGIDCYDTFNKDLLDNKDLKKDLGIGKDDISVFFVGRLSKEKKPDVFVEAAKRILKKSENIKMFVIGDGPMGKDIGDSIKKLPSDKIKYLGYQSDVAKYLSVADVFVLPSEIEGFPLSILEAMATEAVVIASKVGAVPDVIKNGKSGYIITPSSVSEIERNVLRLNKDRPLLKKIGRSARLEVEKKYSNKILGENYIKLYEETIK